MTYMAKKKAPLRKPGSSGGGTGKQWRDALRLELARADGPTGTALERIARIVVHDALNGDYVAIQEIANRIDGKVAVQENAGSDEPVQKLIVTWEGPAPAVDRAPHTKVIEHQSSPAGTADAQFSGSVRNEPVPHSEVAQGAKEENLHGE